MTTKKALKKAPKNAPQKELVKSIANTSNGLQRFTDIKSKEQIKAYLDQPGQDYQGLQNHLFNNCKSDLSLIQLIMEKGEYNIQSSGFNDYENNNELLLYFWEYASQKHNNENNKGMLESHRRDNYTVNREIILKLYNDYTISKGKLPSITNISAHTGLSRTTVTKHFKDLKNEGYLQDILDGSYILVDSVLAHLYKIGIQSSDVKALKAFLDWHRDKAARVLQKNYIQINNLILTEDDIKTLPQESVIEIENFVKKFQSIKEQKIILPKIETN